MAELDTNKVYPVGAKVEIRDAVWRILSVDAVREGGQLLKCEGLSNIVLGRVVYFFTLYEDAVKLLTPEETVLAKDTSSRFIQTRLYIESICVLHLRQKMTSFMYLIKLPWTRCPISLIQHFKLLNSRVPES